MNKRYILIPILLLFGLFLASCKNKSNNINPITPNFVGNIYISSFPTSAQIWLDGTDTKKVTPDSIINLNTGSHTIVLKLTDYLDDTVSVNVQDGSHIMIARTLLSDKSITSYGPDTIGTTGFPGGIILKSGRSSPIASGDKDSVDVYYSSNGFVVASSSSSINNRSTSFFVGLNTDLNDGVSSPTKLDSWVTQVPNSSSNYFFLYDSDSHYSKMIITDRGGGTTGNPTWIKVQWLYNNKQNDRRF